MRGGDSGHPGDDEWLDLADALDLLRGQIGEAQRRARTADVRFDVEAITVDFEVELGRTHGGSGGLRFGIAQADGRRESARRAVQRVSLTLTPRTAARGDLTIGDGES
ncbi:trypco2 family protein [Streptomyces sp. RK9]|uniref:trypco2 family protein n=1 Tax=Streptomyces sp. RK9 TaxID=3239284 RepID=UPI003866F19C